MSEALWLRRWLVEGMLPLMAAILLSPPTAQAFSGVDAAGPDAPTFTKDVAPIVFARCAICHRPGGSAPFTLLTFDDVRRRARQIGEVTVRRLMPPWLPEPGYGTFLGERRLTDREINVIQRWIDGGAAEGDRSDMPPVPLWTEGWYLGKPDLVVEMSEPYVIPANGSDVFRKFVIPIPVSATRYVRAVEFRPGNTRILHHAIAKIDRTGSARQVDALNPEPGYGGMTFTEGENPDGQFIGWSPGKIPVPAPEGLAWRLDPGADLVVQLHLRPNGRVERIRSAVGFFFTDRPPQNIPFGLYLGSYTIDIAAGKADYVVEDSYVLPVDVEVLSVYPHAHYLCRDVRASAILPDGTTKSLIWIKAWDFNWQDEYRFATPVFLPKGTTLEMRFTYDNSDKNTHNPNHPPQRVAYGGRSSDEMANMLFQVLPRGAADLAVLKDDFDRQATTRYIAAYQKMLREWPNNPVVDEALAACYYHIGSMPAAVVHAQRSLHLRPDNPYMHYTLGMALSAQGELRKAAGHFRDAVRIKPDYAEAHNNLGVMLQSLGEVDEAIRHYRLAIKAAPDFGDAHNNLGQALASQGRLEESIDHYREALRIHPDRPASLVGLAWILATHPDPGIRRVDEAVRLAERAADTTKHRNAATLDVLAATYAAAGRFDEAVRTAEDALALAADAGSEELARLIRLRLELYRQGMPYREPRRGGSSVFERTVGPPIGSLGAGR